ncbi:heavy metal translocating P-type ATPase [Cellulomonas chengniuliangii]|uniref:Heavy metal translocating P-type ATPase n=1 Tax=Cellulomonas chengniuliangii TaxID=2968084 RepID=A0ABY5KY81_9CELL|nr:heavy metal translocating P-type ATPase [Cellulomonas chengniuliangii]MCC2307777.1 heavy metal translocating P-type ATPase [Cellulomonas chengniuliangii]UUI75466.1 heavy metal translocating P-type ATPase [Cellulomonas chengniuliangii]
MRWWHTLVRQYPLVLATLGVAALGGVLVAVGDHDAARWVVTGYALVIAAVQAVSMIRELRAGTWGIDILAVTAIVATVAVGEEWAALVIVLMLTGGVALEDYAAGRARRELASLLDAAPRTAHAVGPDGSVADVPVDEVRPGDELMVTPGEVVPVDGVLLGLPAVFDESSLTGESMPVEHVPGDGLLSGSVNGTTGVRMRATAAAGDSQYQHIIALVREASESKAPFVRLADRVAVPFTAVAFAIAGLAWAVTGDAVRFAEVLVVATPCPLLIATPVAFLAGLSRASRNGIIVKNGGALEKLARIRTAAFDKTGTLTFGRPDVVAVTPSDGLSSDELLRLAASVEQASNHALAASIVGAARERGLRLSPAENVRESTGHGVSALVDGHTVVVGKEGFVAEAVEPTASREGCAVEPADLEPGQLAVHLAVDGAYAGVVTLADAVRPEALHTVTRLRGLGVRHVVMLSGDAEATARHVADAVGVDEYRADCLPADKVAAVQAMSDRPVMMIGDGVNDAPVLAVADVGVAMGAKGSSAASESADVVILLDDVDRAACAVSIGRRTVQVAMQAIAIGVGISLLLMVAAAFGAIPAIVGAGLQELVDLTTILWALRASSPRRSEPADAESAPRPVLVAATHATA